MTPKEINLKEIHLLLETFTEQFRQACEHPVTIPLIEMDLMKQTIRNLYTQLDQLGKMKEFPVAQTPYITKATAEIIQPIIAVQHSEPLEILQEKQIQVTFDEELPVVPEEKAEVPVSVIAAVHQESTSVAESRMISKVEINPVQDEVVQEENNTNIETGIIEKTSTTIVTSTTVNTQKEPAKNIKPEIKKGFVGGLFDEAPSVASKFNPAESIYDKIAKTKQDPSLADKLNMKPLEDLKKSIGINARFAFINELFSGDQYLFHESIDRINKSSAFEEARKVLYEDLADKMKWNTSSKSFNDLEELVKRRFGV